MIKTLATALVFAILYLPAQLSGQSAFQNILVGNLNNPNEPAIAISLTDTNTLMAAANTDQVFYSHDGGKTWQHSFATSNYGVFGDPCLVADSNSNFYYFHLAKNLNIEEWPKYADRIVCQRTNTTGNIWQADSYAGNNVGHMQDKEWAAVDLKNNLIYVTWTQFDQYGSSNPVDSSTIYFSKSADGGVNWSNAALLTSIAGDCVDGDSTIEGAMPAVGVNGEVYVTWAFGEKIYFNKSVSGGASWSANEQVVANQLAGWDYLVDGINRCNGLPIIACDLSSSANRGNVYINWTDKNNGAHDADVYLIKSIDGGQTWQTPVRVNDDPAGKENFSSWMTVDQSNGDVYVLFYDRRNYNNDSTDVYLARSTDGGNTFINYRISESGFYPDENIFHGDYNNVAAVNGCVRPIWTRQDNGNTSVFTALVNFPQGSTTSIPTTTAADFKWRLASSNPTKGPCLIATEQLLGPAEIAVLDVAGRELYVQQQVQPASFVRLNLADLGVASGVYFLLCKDGTGVRTFKILLQQ